MIIFKNLILKISSLRFAISLIIFIAITSGVGTFIPQGGSNKFYIDNFDSAPIFGFLGKIYGQIPSYYTSFVALIAIIMGLNLLGILKFQFPNGPDLSLIHI